MEAMKEFPNDYFDLAVVDPPYGIGHKFKGGKTGKMNFNEIVNKDWDKVPTIEYWEQLFRISKNQIVWGGNYFHLPPTRCFIVWDKLISEDFSLAMAEFAWTSFDKLAKIKRMPTPKDGNKIHPTQKPVKLYSWIYHNYLPQGGKVIDTHLGSGSNRIAADKAGNIEFYGYEIDQDYFNDQEKRWRNYKAQLSMF